MVSSLSARICISVCAIVTQIVGARLAVAQPPAAAPVRVARLEHSVLQQRHAVIGTLKAVARGEVAALEPGQLRELSVQEGDTIKKGDIIARVDDRRLRVQHAEALAEREVIVAEIDSLQAMLDRTLADLDRASSLAKQSSISQQEVDLAEANHRVALANLEGARRRIARMEQGIKLLEVRLEDTAVRAPYDAAVIDRHVEPGDWVQAGEPLLTLVSTGAIEAWLEVPERYIDAIDKFGASVIVRPTATHEDCVVQSTRRIAEVNPRVRTLPFVATLDNPTGLLTPGMSVEGWIATTEEAPTTSIPKDAVVRINGQPLVYRIQESDGKTTVAQMPLRILFETGERIAIQAVGLKPEDRVVVEGNERLLPGQEVMVVQ